MRTCPKCAAERAASDFYAGHSSCKECVKARARANREANIDRVRDYARRRFREDLERRVSTLSRSAARTRTHREEHMARIAVNNAVRDRRLTRKPCEVCGAEKVEAHHDDYSKPLDVRWLCRSHHMAHHRRVNAEKRSA